MQNNRRQQFLQLITLCPFVPSVAPWLFYHGVTECTEKHGDYELTQLLIHHSFCQKETGTEYPLIFLKTSAQYATNAPLLRMLIKVERLVKFGG
jgi:hypothetical protein